MHFPAATNATHTHSLCWSTTTVYASKYSNIYNSHPHAIVAIQQQLPKAMDQIFSSSAKTKLFSYKICKSHFSNHIKRQKQFLKDRSQIIFFENSLVNGSGAKHMQFKLILKAQDNQKAFYTCLEVGYSN